MITTIILLIVTLLIAIYLAHICGFAPANPVKYIAVMIYAVLLLYLFFIILEVIGLLVALDCLPMYRKRVYVEYRQSLQTQKNLEH